MARRVNLKVFYAVLAVLVLAGAAVVLALSVAPT